MNTVGRIHSTESMGSVDGPGIRFIIFTQGCLMRCLYCHNRDTWDLKGGKEITADDLLPEIRSYKPFFNASGGGVTVSGGEPLLQAKFVADLFEKLKAEGIHCVLDTNGFARELNDDIKRVVELADLVLLDIKHTDDAKHHELTHQHVDNTLRFANYLAEVKKPTWIRRVVVPGYSDDPQEIEALAKQCQTWGNVGKNGTSPPPSPRRLQMGRTRQRLSSKRCPCPNERANEISGRSCSSVRS